MKAFRASLAFVVLSLGAASVSGLEGWEFLKDQDGITVHRKDIPGSPIVAMRGEAEIDAPVSKVASVLLDTGRLHEWVDSLQEARRVTTHSPLHYVEYSHVRAPRFAADRDFVVEKRAEIDADKREFTLRFRSVDDPKAPDSKPGCVRGRLERGVYRLIADGKRTRLVVEIQADPAGSVPKWLVNFFQRDWPINTIQGIRKQVKRTDVKELPAIRDALTHEESTTTGARQNELAVQKKAGRR